MDTITHHPITHFVKDDTLDFDTLFAELNKEVENGNINRQIHNGLYLYDYSRECQYSGTWNEATRISRGLVLDPFSKEVVALPLPKFFNYGAEHRQHGTPIGEPRWKGSEVLEKMDGSCGICFHHEGEWKVCTRGSFTSEQAQWATKWLNENVDTSKMFTHFTYVFEIIYDTNRIVINYDYEGLVLLTIVHRNKYFECNVELVDAYARDLDVKRPKTYEFNNISEIVKIAKTLPKDDEGFVVKFASGTRVKIKGDEYCRIHKILSHHSPLVVWENFRDKGMDFVHDYKLEIPEEFWEETDDWLSHYVTRLGKMTSDLLIASREYERMTNKELGLALPNMDEPEWVKNFLFTLRKLDNPSDIFGIGSKARKKVFDFFKPVGNIIS